MLKWTSSFGNDFNFECYQKKESLFKHLKVMSHSFKNLDFSF